MEKKKKKKKARHTIIDWLACARRDFKDHPVATPLPGHQPPDQVAHSPIQPGLEHLQGWGIHSFSGQPVPVPHHALSEEFPPNIKSNSPLLV